MKKSLSRRTFLKYSSAAAGFTAWSFSHADEAKRRPPNEKLNLGVIGCGAGSQGDYNLSNVTSENIVALCDVDSNRAGKAREAHPRAAFFQDYRKLLDMKGLDAVVISTPDHMHAFPAVRAMNAGLHVYCEKPLAHCVNEVRLMMKLAAKNKLVTQMGTQIHAGDNYRRVVEIVQSGVLGPIERVHVWCGRHPDNRKISKKPVAVPASLDYDLWLGPAPARPYDPAFLPFHWRWWFDFGGGVLADMACHFMDLPHWALGLRTPTSIEAKGHKPTGVDYDVPDKLQVDYRYPARGAKPGVHLTWYSGCPGPSLDAKSPFHGYGDGVLFGGQKGQLLANYGQHMLLPEEDYKDFKAPPQTIKRSVGHHREWIEAIKSGGMTTCNFAYSGALAETVLLGNVAYRSGKKIEWNEEKGTADSPEAAHYLERAYRKGWKLG